MTPYEELIHHRREAHLLESTAEVLGWDQETMMPPGGVDHRAKQLALLAGLAHERLTDERVGDWLEACESSSGDDPDRSINLREIRREYDRKTKLPASLVREWADVTSRAQHVWADAREKSDFQIFAPWLTRLVELARSKADCLLEVTVDANESWDALAEEFEPGMRAADLDPLFGPLRGELSDLTAELAAGRMPSNAFNQLKLSTASQEAFVRHVATAMGFDFQRGRMDRSAHPFCGGSHGGDVRITTRFHDDNALDALGSTMHEAGHGLYEQGLRDDAVGTPAGTAISLGIHESQSRLWENHVGRSRAFWVWAAPLLPEFFGREVGSRFDAEAMFATANLVRPSLIRVEADEVTYNLHVLARYELERALIRDDLAIEDLPAAWNELYLDLLGVEVPDDRRGCLQDVHWSCGLFGYFPTYTLGSVYAAQFFDAAEGSVDDLAGKVSRGEFGPLREWLRQNVHRHGMHFQPGDLCRNATGNPLDPKLLTTYLARKLRPLYGLSEFGSE